MPRVPGREPTKMVATVEEVTVGSFIMEYETKTWRRICNIEGCEHRMGPDTTKPKWTDWEPCTRNYLPAFIYKIKGLKYAGMACPCCVGKILEKEG